MPDSPSSDRARALGAKRQWHRDQANLTLREKFRILLDLQRQDLPILAARGALEPWQTPWNVDP